MATATTRRWAWVVALAMFLSVAGCRRDDFVENTRPIGYTGPTLALPELVERINANNAAVPSLWSRLYYEANLVDEEGKAHFVNGDGNLLYLKPRNMLLRGRKDIAGTVFEVGSTEDRYWLTLVPEIETMWWGWYRNLGKPCAGDIPLHPDLLLEVLGVNVIEPDLLRPPVPLLRFNPDADAYMLVWAVEGPTQWAAVKEVWYDRQTLLPKLVLLFDENGRVILRAYLAQHRPVEVEGQPREAWPVVATQYRLYFPENRSRMFFELRDVQLQRNNIPNARSIRFPREPGVARVIQIDEACERSIAPPARTVE